MVGHGLPGLTAKAALSLAENGNPLKVKIQFLSVEKLLIFMECGAGGSCVVVDGAAAVVVVVVVVVVFVVVIVIVVVAGLLVVVVVVVNAAFLAQ